jgi:hypothetical protein
MHEAAMDKLIELELLLLNPGHNMNKNQLQLVYVPKHTRKIAPVPEIYHFTAHVYHFKSS